jgi:hypothetical protein
MAPRFRLPNSPSHGATCNGKNKNSGSQPRLLSILQMDAKLNRIVTGLIQRHVQYIHHDPYANTFRTDDSYVFSAKQKLLGRHDLIST